MTTSTSLDRAFSYRPPHLCALRKVSQEHSPIPRLTYMEHTGDSIAETVQTQFESLPAKRKPHSRASGVREWVPLSGVVAEGTQSRPRILALRADRHPFLQEEIA